MSTARSVGRPTLYRADYPHIAALLLADGYAQHNIADALRIGLSTLVDWKRQHPEFGRVFAVDECRPSEQTAESGGDSDFRESKTETFGPPDGDSRTTRVVANSTRPQLERVPAHERLERPRRPRVAIF